MGEALPTSMRQRLVRIYHAAGMTDEDIAARMTQTVYTTSRIRSSMGLAPNPRGAADA